MSHGYHVTVQSNIEGLRRIIKDRYRTGYAVIKELVQNADDAGATTLDIGWVKGDADARHPLLRGPAIFLLNNGAFEQEHALGLHQYHAGSKGADVLKIGRFGLGLKSVFHLCEAFFYLSNASWQEDEYKHCDLLNPWHCPKGGQHPEWDDLGTDWETVLRDRLRLLLNDEHYSKGPWFCILLPLRMLRHCTPKWAIEPKYPGDDASPPPEIFSPQRYAETAHLLPLLRTLRHIGFWQANNRSLELAAEIGFEDGTERCSFLEDFEPAKPFFGGRIACRECGVPRNLTFAGHHRKLAVPEVESLKQDPLWPVTHCLTKDGFTPFREKAEAHTGVVISESPCSPGAGKLSIRWTVFLPVGDEPQEQIEHGGQWDFMVSLHGYFFVDAGRLEVAFPETKKEIGPTLKWNRLLRDEGTLKLLIPALEHYVERLPPGKEADSRLQALTGALASSKLFGTYRQTICSEKQWAFAASSTGFRWQAIPSDTTLLSLPESRNDELPLTVFPGLRHDGQVWITLDGHPHLSPKEPAPWDTQSLAKLIDGLDLTVVLQNKACFSYLVDALERVASSAPGNDGIHEQIHSIARGSTHHFDRLRLQPELAQRLFACVRPSCRLQIPFDEGLVTESKNLYGRLLSLGLSCLLIPDFAEPEGTPGQAVLSTDEINSALQCLATTQPIGKQEEDFLRLRARIAIRFLSAWDGGQGADFLSTFGSFELFPVRDRRTQNVSAISLQEIARQHERGLLFKGGPMLINLQQAMQDDTVLVLQAAEIIPLLTKHGISVRDCAQQECVKALNAYPRLRDWDDRCLLIPDLLCVWQTADRAVIRAIRYLLHAQPNADSTNAFAELIVASDGFDPWGHLANLVLSAHGARWRLVEAERAGTIPEAAWSALGIARATPSCVVSLLQGVDGNAVDCGSLSSDERQAIIVGWPTQAVNLLKKLRIFLSVDSELVLITERTFSQGSYQIGPGVLRDLILLKCDQTAGPVFAARLRELAPELTAERAISEVLKQPASCEQWQFILNALPDDLSDALEAQLKNTAWLPPADGRTAIPPAKVLRIKGLEDRLGSISILTGRVFSVDQIDPAVQQHPAWGRIEDLFTRGDQALDLLADALTQDDDYHIGTFQLDNTLFRVFLNAFGQEDTLMPTACIMREVIEAADDAENARSRLQAHLLPQLQKPLPVARLTDVLKHLAELHKGAPEDAKGPLLRLFNSHLRVAANSGAIRQLLADIPLFTKAGTWSAPAKIALGEANIAPTHVLNDEQRQILGAHLTVAFAPLPANQPTNVHQTAWPTEEEFATGRRLLASLLASWQSQVEPDFIACMLSLLGDNDGFPNLFEGHKGRVSLSLFRMEFGWTSHAAGPCIEDAMRKHHFVIKEAPRDIVVTRNLLGDELRAPVAQNLDELFDSFEAQTYLHETGGDRCYTLHLRAFPEGLDEKRIESILKKTASSLLERVYGQQPEQLDRVWRQIKPGGQLDIRIAQAMILESSLFYLQGQLGTKGNAQLDGIFQRWHSARTDRETTSAALKAAEAEQAYERIDRLKGKLGNIAGTLAALREDLCSILTSNPEVQHAIVSAIQQKLWEQGYRAQSIPFELFQNADDAVVELEHLGHTLPDRLSQSFIVDQNNDTLWFLHWGRAINQFIGEEGRAKGFDRDLEKMLVLTASDKAGSAAEPSATTGRFGLGFKSVFFVTDCPRVISGRSSRFEVLGGVYPKELAASKRDALCRLLRDNGDAACTGTVIELPLRQKDGRTPDGILKEFVRLASFLVVFSRRVRTCEIREDGKRKRLASWKPKLFGGLEGIEIGDIPGGKAMVFRKDSNVMLLALDANGFTSAPLEGIPSIWITAPIHEKANAGVLLGGAFDPNPGRTELRATELRATDANATIAAQAGLFFGEALIKLYERTAADWSQLRQDLGLSTSLTSADLWRSLWEAVAESLCEKRRSEAGSKALFLIHKALFGGRSNGMLRLLKDKTALPTGLWGEYDRLTCWDSVKYSADGALGDQETFEKVAHWEWLRDAHPPGTVVSSRIGKVMRGLDSNTEIISLTLSSLIDSWLPRDNRVPVRMAQMAGTSITHDYMNKLRSIMPDEFGRMQPRLRKILFKNRCGEWCPADQLLLAQSQESNEETLRAAFAPEERILSPEYAGSAIHFFLACRERMNADTETLVQWMRRAEPDKREAALRYLIEGELAFGVQQCFRSRPVPSWLDALDANVLRKFGPDQEQIILGRIGRPPVDGHDVNTEAILERLMQWWDANHTAITNEYERLVYPDFFTPWKLSRDTAKLRDDPEARKGWMILFMLGAMHTMGRTRFAQHKGFIQECHATRWLQTLSQPQVEPTEWIRAVHEYFENQTQDSEYLLWMRQLFVPTYQFARWLPAYVNSFLWAIQLPQHTTFTMDKVTKPRTNDCFRGTTGFDAPPVARTLGIGASFVLRELVRTADNDRDHSCLHPWCFVPYGRVRQLVNEIAGREAPGTPSWGQASDCSKLIHTFLVQKLGESAATFGRSFDIPLLMLTQRRYASKREELLQLSLEFDDEDIDEVRLP